MAKVTIQDQISIATRAIEAGIMEILILNALISSGIPKFRAETILRWAKLNAIPLEPDTIPTPALFAE